MLSRNKSRSVGKVKLLLTLPLMLILVLCIGVINGSISFASGLKESNEKVFTKEQTDDVYTYCDQMPEFPGGMEALTNYMVTNIKYPEAAKKNGVHGKVYIQFIVDKDGSLTDIHATKTLDKELDNEAIRVIKMMPKWNPGRDKGQPVKVQIVMPVVFALK